MNERNIIILNEKDNVAVALDDLAEGAAISIQGKSQPKTITLRNAVPFGHKFALHPIKKGNDIVKYGEVIGRATSDIAEGEYVHIHNVESVRFSAR
jgi:altronate dehydratase small subunit